MAVCGNLLVNGLAKVKRADNCGRGEVEYLCNCLFELVFCYRTRAEGVNTYRNGLGNADSVCKLNLALLCKACGNNILCNIACCIGSAAVNLRRVLAGESTAAVA